MERRGPGLAALGALGRRLLWALPAYAAGLLGLGAGALLLALALYAGWRRRRRDRERGLRLAARLQSDEEAAVRAAAAGLGAARGELPAWVSGWPPAALRRYPRRRQRDRLGIPRQRWDRPPRGCPEPVSVAPGRGHPRLPHCGLSPRFLPVGPGGPDPAAPRPRLGFPYRAGPPGPGSSPSAAPRTPLGLPRGPPHHRSAPRCTEPRLSFPGPGHPAPQPPLHRGAPVGAKRCIAPRAVPERGFPAWPPAVR